MKYGRLPAHDPATHPRLQLGPALDLSTIAPPAAVDELSAVADWPMYLNDSLGDCTIAAAGHMIEAWTRLGRGTTVEISDAQVLTAYEAVGGYRPGHPDTDQGAVMQDVLGYWRKTGIGGQKILAFAELDVRNAAEVRAALWLFGHVYIGLNVPLSAEQQFDAGQPWDVVANDGGIQGGHAVDVGAYDANGVRLVTWAAVQRMTAAFWAKYVEEAWVVVDEAWISQAGGSPPGLDTAALNAQYQALTGQPGPFPVGPPPPPPPTPAPPADPDQALAAVAHPWVREHHTAIGGNHAMANALKAWLAQKGL